jgi:hypothetical protein
VINIKRTPISDNKYEVEINVSDKPSWELSDEDYDQLGIITIPKNGLDLENPIDARTSEEERWIYHYYQDGEKVGELDSKKRLHD